MKHSKHIPVLEYCQHIILPHFNKRRTLRLDKSGEENSLAKNSPYSHGWVWLESKQEEMFKFITASETLQEAGRYVILLDCRPEGLTSSLLFYPKDGDEPITFRKEFNSCPFGLEDKLWSLVEVAENHTAILSLKESWRKEYNYDCKPYSMSRIQPSMGGCTIRHYLQPDWSGNEYKQE